MAEAPFYEALDSIQAALDDGKNPHRFNELIIQHFNHFLGFLACQLHDLEDIVCTVNVEGSARQLAFKMVESDELMSCFVELWIDGNLAGRERDTPLLEWIDAHVGLQFKLNLGEDLLVRSERGLLSITCFFNGGFIDETNLKFQVRVSEMLYDGRHLAALSESLADFDTEKDLPLVTLPVANCAGRYSWREVAFRAGRECAANYEEMSFRLNPAQVRALFTVLYEYLSRGDLSGYQNLHLHYKN